MKILNRTTMAAMLVNLLCACSSQPVNTDTGVGLQMYSVRSLMSDYARSHDTHIIQEIAGMGYDYVEAYSYADGKFSNQTPADFKKDVEAAGLYISSSHFNIELTPEELESGDFSASLAKWDSAIAAHKEAGIKNIIMAYMQNPPKSLAAWKVYSDYFNAVGKKCKAAGMGFGYHNHWFEFEEADGVLPYDYLLQNTDSKYVFFELDTYWMLNKQQDPVEWINRYPGRFKMIHIKDKTVVGESGEIDFDAILDLREKAGAENTIIEVEWYGDQSVEAAVSKSLINLRSLLDKRAGKYSDSDLCVLEIFDTETGARTEVKRFSETIEAPNWTPDGKWLIYNSKGLLYRIAADGSSEPELIPTGAVDNANNDHCLTFDGKMIGISSGTKADWRSHIYVCPIEGGEPVEVTPVGPSYLHGWSPDSKSLVYCADRGGEFDVYRISVDGGEEERLTDAPGLDDGPEYTPSGDKIWFNSVRSGLMQLWRMNPDGSSQEQMTFEENRNAWFGHVSPDGQNVVFITYWKGDLEPGEHLGDRYVELRVMPAEGGRPVTKVALYGGQGTINVNSWSPDSKKFAFVSWVKK